MTSHLTGLRWVELRLWVVSVAAGLTAAVIAGPVGASPSTGTSSNWSGYAVTGPEFSSVQAGWIQPAAQCSFDSTSPTLASFWVGLGGNSVTARNSKVEQIGSDSDCERDGQTSYYAWYELWPAKPVNLRLGVRPGDSMRASVRIERGRVILRLANLTTGARVTRSLPMARPDTTSAEWIAEAPSLSVPGGSQTAAMTNFGTVRFTDARATAGDGRAGTITSPDWHASAIGFESDQPGGRASPAARFFDQTTAARGLPSVPTASGSAFSITWRSGAVAMEPPAGAI